MCKIKEKYINKEYCTLNSKLLGSTNTATTIGDWTLSYAKLGNGLMYIHATRTVNNAGVASTSVALSNLPFAAPYPQRLSGVHHVNGVPVNAVYAFISNNQISWGHAAYASGASQFDIFGIVKVSE